MSRVTLLGGNCELNLKVLSGLKNAFGYHGDLDFQKFAEKQRERAKDKRNDEAVENQIKKRFLQITIR